MADLFDTQTLASIASTATGTESTPAMTAIHTEVEEEDYARNIQNVLVDNITMIVQVFCNDKVVAGSCVNAQI